MLPAGHDACLKRAPADTSSMRRPMAASIFARLTEPSDSSSMRLFEQYRLLGGHPGVAPAVEQFLIGNEVVLLDLRHGAQGPWSGQEPLQICSRLRVLPVGAFGCDHNAAVALGGNAAVASRACSIASGNRSALGPLLRE